MGTYISDMGVGSTYKDAQGLTMIRVKLIILSTTTQIMIEKDKQMDQAV